MEGSDHSSYVSNPSLDPKDATRRNDRHGQNNTVMPLLRNGLSF